MLPAPSITVSFIRISLPVTPVMLFAELLAREIVAVSGARTNVLVGNPLVFESCSVAPPPASEPMFTIPRL